RWRVRCRFPGCKARKCAGPRHNGRSADSIPARAYRRICREGTRARDGRIPAHHRSRGLMSYGPNQIDLWRRAATYVHKIFKGANAAELPVEQPTKFELVVNLRTARQIGIELPTSILLRADELIE